ncbi:MAG: protein translocase subunit SecD [Chloroflexi bacterium]|nr:protein translocase subunit SecD [Chloroflexota bacterium]
MNQRSPRALIAVLLLAAAALWVDLDFSHGEWYKSLLFWRPAESRDLKVVLGLDLQGGQEVLLQPDPGPGQIIKSDDIVAAIVVITKRINALGVAEALIQKVGLDRIAVQLPGVKDPDQAIKTFGQTGLLEFIDTGEVSVPEGTLVTTTGFSGSADSGTPAASATSAPTTPATRAPTLSPTGAATTPLSGTTGVTATASVTPSAPLSPTLPLTQTPALGPYRTIMTGIHIESAQVGFDQTTNEPIVQFTLKSDGARIFADYTSKNVGRYLTIVLDKRVISSPRIQSAILQGSGQISGNFTRDSAESLSVQIRYGALPVPLKILSSRTVGPTLGQDSINKSLLAGLIGIGAVVIFMLLYYRLPGLLANLALILYGGLVFAIFKLLPVTLTLAGIAGFVLSIGMAVDANVLIFERMKEELRAGRSLRSAMRAGFERAWLSIRDSNISSLITCAILFWFGSNFGASIVAGFALTLAIGILVSLFTAIFVTRTLMNFVIDSELVKNLWWYGVGSSNEPGA